MASPYGGKTLGLIIFWVSVLGLSAHNHMAPTWSSSSSSWYLSTHILNVYLSLLSSFCSPSGTAICFVMHTPLAWTSAGYRQITWRPLPAAQRPVYLDPHHHPSMGLEIQGSKLPGSHDLTDPACLVLLEALWNLTFDLSVCFTLVGQLGCLSCPTGFQLPEQ